MEEEKLFWNYKLIIKSEFIVSGERMEGKVMKQLRRALQPILKNVSVDWGDLPIPKKYSFPIDYPPIFAGERLIFYTFINGEELKDSHTVTITGTTGEENFSWDIHVDIDQNKFGTHLHRCAAHYLIKLFFISS